jgi:pterin-4a-carbinolamine dehydratase
MSERISPKQFHEAEGIQDWRVLGEGACAYFRTGSFAAGARLVDAISELASLDAHHPDVDVRHDGVTVRLITITDDYYGLSSATSSWPGRSRRWRASSVLPPTPRPCRRSSSRSTRSSVPR